MNENLKKINGIRVALLEPQGTREPENQGTREAGKQGTREPGNQGSREPGIQGNVWFFKGFLQF